MVAVSGGVDSMSLLHLLHNRNTNNDLKLLVAHLDHGIRADAEQDRILVQNTANDYGLPFVFHEANLGSGASEDTARKARYAFLEKVRDTSDAQAIITAHHSDDVLETAIHNMLRGTGRKGITSLSAREGIERPLLNITKQELIDYAKEHQLVWHEDATNQNTAYSRNYIRHRLLPRFDANSKNALHDVIKSLRTVNTLLDEELVEQLNIHLEKGKLDRHWFIQLSHNIAQEVMASWLRQTGVSNFDAKIIERLVIAAKVSTTGSRFDVLGATRMQVSKDYLALDRHER